jgi:hypothetical protein
MVRTTVLSFFLGGWETDSMILALAVFASTCSSEGHRATGDYSSVYESLCAKHGFVTVCIAHIFPVSV